MRMCMLVLWKQGRLIWRLIRVKIQRGNSTSKKERKREKKERKKREKREKKERKREKT